MHNNKSILSVIVVIIIMFDNMFLSGQTWHHLRVTLTADLTSPKMISSFLPQVEEIADDWCNLFRQFRNSECVIENLEDIVSKLGKS